MSDTLPAADATPAYPPGPVGLLMQQRDAAKVAGEAARTQAEMFASIADARCAEVDAFDEAIRSLGGEPAPDA
jgi:hypothetical protein